jgi:hypothetical protein
MEETVEEAIAGDAAPAAEDAPAEAEDTPAAS